MVWIQNVMMLRQIRNRSSILGLVLSSDNQIDLKEVVAEKTRGYEDEGGKELPRDQGLFSNHTRPFSGRELALIRSLRKKDPRFCRPLGLPDGPSWKHPRTDNSPEKDGAAGAARLTAVLQYPNVVTDAPSRFPLAIVHGPRSRVARSATPADLADRQREYHYALARALIHPAVEHVHLLMNDTKRDLPILFGGLAELCGLPPANLKKIRVRGLGRLATYGEVIAHANEVLPRGTAVLISNSDVYPVGTGWGDLRPRHFGGNQGRRSHILYMLSRHTPRCPPPSNNNINNINNINNLGGRNGSAADRWEGWSAAKTCVDMAKYGSADGFLFRVPVPASVSEELLDIPTHYWGAENRAAAAFVRAGYGRLYNPCNQLALWHHHCSGVRTAGPGVPRVNRGAGGSRTGKWVSSLDEIS